MPDYNGPRRIGIKWRGPSILVLYLFLTGCNASNSQQISRRVTRPQSDSRNLKFVDITKQACIRFHHETGARGDHHFIETTSGGCALFDYDGDGALDAFFVQAGPVPRSYPDRPADRKRPRCMLYRNLGNGTFQDVTKIAGLDQDLGYAQGVAVADYDNDGYEDLYVTAYGGNHLLHNEKGARFKDVTQKAGVVDNLRGPRWSTSAAFSDFDHDGYVDLFVCHYAKWRPEKDIRCSNSSGKGNYCTPDVYTGDEPALYHNQHDGTFVEITKSAGISGHIGRGLGVVLLDSNGDGFDDIFVANDLIPNFLFVNLRNGKFRETAVEQGVSCDEDGMVLAGMGIGVGDYDNNLQEDLIVTNFSNRPFVVYRHASGAFEDATQSSRIGPATMRELGWGCEIADYDLDGFRDVIFANGHVMDDVESFERDIAYRQPMQLFRNRRDGTFFEDKGALGDMSRRQVSRGMSIGDIDNDGDLDILVNNHGSQAELFRNDGGNRNSWITFKTKGSISNRDGIGAKLWLKAGGLTRFAQVHAGSSYASCSDRRVTFGLGKSETVDWLKIRWPNGKQEIIQNLKPRSFYLLTEGRRALPDNAAMTIIRK